MKTLFSLLHGARPPLLNVLAAHIFGAFFAGYVLSISYLDPPMTYVLMATVWILGAGLVSHASEATRSAWRGVRSNLVKLVYILVELAGFSYLLLWLLPAEDASLIIFLHMTLLARILLFVGGQIGRGARP